MATKTPKASRVKRTPKINDIELALKNNHTGFDFNFKKREFKFTEKQKQLIDMINDPHNKIIMIEGPAGTGKSLLAIYTALLNLKEKSVEKLIYLRSIVESSNKSMGALPGTAEEKCHPYNQVMESKLSELVEERDIALLMNSGLIETYPINHIRGYNWKNTFIVADEIQNFTANEILTTLTRIAEGTKMILCGDRMQSDIRNGGFPAIYKLFDDEDSRSHGVVTFKFDEDDIVRSEIIKFIIKKFKEMG